MIAQAAKQETDEPIDPAKGTGQDEYDLIEYPIAVINRVESGLEALEQLYDKVPDVTTDEGYEKAKELIRPYVKVRNKLDKARKNATAHLRAETKRINSMVADDIAPRIEAKEGPLRDALKAEDERQEQIEQEKREKEAARIDIHKEHIATVKKLTADAQTVDNIDSAVSSIESIAEHNFEEFQDAATLTINESMDALKLRREMLVEQEAKQSEMEKELEQLRKEKAEAEAERDALKAKQEPIPEPPKKAAGKRSAVKNKASDFHLDAALIKQWALETGLPIFRTEEGNEARLEIEGHLKAINAIAQAFIDTHGNQEQQQNG